MCLVASGLEPGSCDLNDYPGKPACCCGDLSYGQIREKCIKPQDMVFAKKQTNRKTCYNFKRVMFLLTFHKERIFSLKKISLSFSPLQLGAEIVAPCIMQRKLFSKKKKLFRRPQGYDSSLSKCFIKRLSVKNCSL